MGVPVVLINKWLKIDKKKSKFIHKENQIDNEADVSKYSESSFSIISNWERSNTNINYKGGFKSSFISKHPSNNNELQTPLAKYEQFSFDPEGPEAEKMSK